MAYDKLIRHGVDMGNIYKPAGNNMKQAIDLTGKKYDRLLVIGRAESKKGIPRWNCLCDCGNMKEVAGSELKRGHVRSCGCLRLEKVYHSKQAHGMAHKHPLYDIWMAMKERTTNPNFKQYKDYGGRGIKVCEDWVHDYKSFHEWALNNGWEPGNTIDRIDNDKGYSPDNCRWIDRFEQANNTRKNVILEYNGKKQTIAEWARELNVPYSRIQTRIYRGWPVEKALFEPKMKG